MAVVRFPPHKRPLEDLVVQIAHNDIAFAQAVDDPLVAVAFPALAPRGVESEAAHIGPLRHKAAGDGASIQLFIFMQRAHISLELEPISAEIQRMPYLFLCQCFKYLNFFIAHLRTPVGEALALPLLCQCDNLFIFIQQHMLSPLTSKVSSRAKGRALSNTPPVRSASPACFLPPGRTPLHPPAALPHTPAFRLR